MCTFHLTSGTTHAISDALEQYELREAGDAVPGLPSVAARGLKRSDSNRIGNRRVGWPFIMSGLSDAPTIMKWFYSAPMFHRKQFCSFQVFLSITKKMSEFMFVGSVFEFGAGVINTTMLS